MRSLFKTHCRWVDVDAGVSKILSLFCLISATTLPLLLHQVVLYLKLAALAEKTWYFRSSLYCDWLWREREGEGQEFHKPSMSFHVMFILQFSHCNFFPKVPHFGSFLQVHGAVCSVNWHLAEQTWKKLNIFFLNVFKLVYSLKWICFFLMLLHQMDAMACAEKSWDTFKQFSA